MSCRLRSRQNDENSTPWARGEGGRHASGPLEGEPRTPGGAAARAGAPPARRCPGASCRGALAGTRRSRPSSALSAAPAAGSRGCRSPAWGRQSGLPVTGRTARPPPPCTRQALCPARPGDRGPCPGLPSTPRPGAAAPGPPVSPVRAAGTGHLPAYLGVSRGHLDDEPFCIKKARSHATADEASVGSPAAPRENRFRPGTSRGPRAAPGPRGRPRARVTRRGTETRLRGTRLPHHTLGAPSAAQLRIPVRKPGCHGEHLGARAVHRPAPAPPRPLRPGGLTW